MHRSSRMILEIVQSMPLDHRSADRLHAVALAGQVERLFQPSACGARVEIHVTSPRTGTRWWDVCVLAPDTSAGRALIERLRCVQPLRLDFEAVRELTRLVIEEASQQDRYALPAFVHAA